MNRLTLKAGLFLLLLITNLAACGASDLDAQLAAEAAKYKKLGTVDDKGKCVVEEGNREDQVDVNQDSFPDVRKVYKIVEDERILLCREADLNYDGLKDIVTQYNADGKMIRDEADLDFDGVFDIITYYENGMIVRQEVDTNSDGKIDRLRFVRNGQTFRMEGDSNNDSYIDYWEYYDKGKLLRVGYDLDADGSADKWDRNEIALEEEIYSEDQAEPEEEEKKEPEKETEKEDKKDNTM